MHECLLCKRDMKVSDDIFGKGCVKNIYSFLDWRMPKKAYFPVHYIIWHIIR